jgi:hypothetical protein
MKRKETMKNPIVTNQPTEAVGNRRKPLLSTQHDGAPNSARQPSTVSHPFRMTHGADKALTFFVD